MSRTEARLSAGGREEYKCRVHSKAMPATAATNTLYIVIMYTLMMAGAIAWIFFLEATLSRDRVNV